MDNSQVFTCIVLLVALTDNLNRLLFGMSFAGKLKNDNNNIIVYNFLIIAELKNYCSDCEKDTVVERERGKGMERY